MKPYKSLDTSYILQFSHCKPENVVLQNEDDSPTADAIDIGFELSNTQPMLMFVFSATDEQDCPSISSIANVMREGYRNTTHNQPLNESYGLLLDALRMISSGQSVQSTASEMMNEQPEAIVPMRVLQNGAIVYVEENLCWLRVAPVTQFKV